MTTATAILLIQYEVDALHPSDPSVATMHQHANDVLNAVAGLAARDGVVVGNVYAFSLGLPAPDAPGPPAPTDPAPSDPDAP